MTFSYRLQTIFTLATSQLYLHSLYNDQLSVNTLTSFNITVEAQRRNTFKNHWDETIYNINQIAKEEYFNVQFLPLHAHWLRALTVSPTRSNIQAIV